MIEPVGNDPIDEPIELHRHDPSWVGWFVVERDRILRVEKLIADSNAVG
jgi:hypothetical protein